MNGPEHYRKAEELLDVDWMSSYAATALAAAQVHATLALTAATVEAQRADQFGDIMLRQPLPGDEADPAYPGSAWGRALYGDLHLSKEAHR